MTVDHAMQTPASPVLARPPLEDGLTLFRLHRALLGDAARNHAYREALNRHRCSGKVVLDLGAGTGLLGLMACQAGARKVVAIERGPFETLLRDLFRENGHLDRLVFVPADSLEVELRQEADLIVTETLGNLAFEEEILTYLPDARQRLLRQGGGLIPSRIRLLAAPVSSELPILVELRQGAVTRGLQEQLLRGPWIEQVPSAQLLGPPSVLASVDLGRVQPAPLLHWQQTLQAECEAELGAVVAWFEADLAPGVTLGTGPGDAPTHWRQVLFPLPRPRRVSTGSTICFELQGCAMARSLSWRASIRVGDTTDEEPSRLDAGPASGTSGWRDLGLSAKGRTELRLLRQRLEGRTIDELAAGLAADEPSRFAETSAALQRVTEMIWRTGA